MQGLQRGKPFPILPSCPFQTLNLPLKFLQLHLSLKTQDRFQLQNLSAATCPHFHQENQPLLIPFLQHLGLSVQPAQVRTSIPWPGC